MNYGINLVEILNLLQIIIMIYCPSYYGLDYYFIYVSPNIMGNQIFARDIK